MADKKVEFEITADAASFARGMESAANAVKGGADKIKGHFDGVGKAFEEVQKKLLVITAIVGGGAFFKGAIAEANRFGGEAMNLSKRLGITGSAASTLNIALGAIGSDSGTYIGAFDKFAKKLKENEASMQAMGLQTRDSNGHLRDSQTLMQEALQKVGEYKPGLDQATVAMELFGEGVDDCIKLQKLNNKVTEEAKEWTEALGLTITKEGVAASKEYKEAMISVSDVLMAVQVTVGRAVMPVFADMAKHFAGNGPYVVEVFKKALTGLLLVFRGLQVAVKVFANAIFEAISTIIDVGGLLADVFVKLFSGDWSGAKDAAGRVGSRIGEGFKRAFVTNIKEAVADAQADFAGDVARIWERGTDIEPKKGGKTVGQKSPDAAAEKDKKDPSLMKYYEATLEEEKRLASERDAIHGLSKAAELQFWQDLLQYAQMSEGDKIAATRKASEARIAMLREEAQQARQLGELAAAQWQASELGKVEAAAAVLRVQQAQGLATQEQLLQQELQFEDQRAQIKRAALEARLSMLDPERDPVQVAQLNAELLALEQAHQMQVLQVQAQMAQEQHKVWDDLSNRIGGLWDKGMQALMQGTLTFKGAMQAIFSELTMWFAKSVVGDMVKKWLAGKTAQLTASMLGIGAERAAQTAATSATVAAKATEATAVIGANAAEAASGAASSQSAIPVVGPGLAIAAFAAIMALVLGAKGQVKSARGGFDIPAGVNPLTQLHEKEMVLPAQQADVIRRMGEGGEGGGGQVNVSLNAHPMPGNYFMVHQDQLVQAIKAAQRRFAL